MNKMKKLLSVVLAIVLALSCMSVAASAAKTAYKEVDELTALAAYSPYGQVTRLSVEERSSMILDFLDNVLPGLNINMGEVFNVLGLSVTIDLTSVDRLCYSFDTIKSTFENTLASIAMAIVNLGILESLETGKWVSGMTRDGTAQFTIISTIFAFLSDNTTLVGKVFTDGLDLGIVSLGDMSAIEDIIMNLPGMIKGLIYPMIERWDDTLADIQTYDNSIADESISVETIANNRIKALFTDDMSITTIKYDVNGNMTSEHTNWLNATGSAAPGTPEATSPRCYYQFSSTTPGSVMTVYHIVDTAESEALANDADENNDQAAYTYFAEEQTYVMTEEVAGSGVYVWRATDEWNNIWSLKWYNDESPLLPGFDGTQIDLANQSLAQLLYMFIPSVFENMAPVVLNGSVKKLLAGFLGASFTKIGNVVENDAGTACTLDDEAAAAIPADDQSNEFFTQLQGEYLWEWSDYAVINGNHYYRFENQLFAGDLSQKNNYFDIINWDYEITGDFMDEFVPTNGGSTTDTLLMNLNAFLVKVAKEVLVQEDKVTEDAITGFQSTWKMPALVADATDVDDNENLVENIKKVAQAVVGLAPQHIFGSDWNEDDHSYVNLMLAGYENTTAKTENEDGSYTAYEIKGVTVTGANDEETLALTNDTILTGIAAELVTLIMPSMSLPGKDNILASNAKVGAILAAVVREFAAYLAPEYNFDNLIYADFGTTTDDSVKTFVDPETAGLLSEGSTASGYWFDVILTMGINVGYEYLRAFADLGEDNDVCAGVVSAPVNYMADGGTYAAGTTQATLNAQWEGMVDYIIDWALEADLEFAWAFENIVDTSTFTVDMATAQDPWVKLDTILNALLPIDEILNVTATDCETELEQLLRYDLILAIVDLDWNKLANVLEVPEGFVRDTNVLDQLAAKLKDIVNFIFRELGGGSYNFIPDSITDFDSLAKQDNLVETIKALVGVLYTGLVTNGGCRTIFPFLNFLFGWKTDPQKIADPVMGYQFKANKDYAFQGTTDDEAGEVGKGSSASTGTAISGTYITFLNNSAGMLETHRNSTTVDHAYDINIKSVTFDATTNNDLSASYVTVADDGTETTADTVVEPYEKVWVKVNGTYKGDEAVTMTVAYDYVGKDGQAVGGTQYTSYTFLISGLYEDADRIGTQANDHDNSYGGIYDFKSYVFTEDLYKSVTEYEQEIHYVSASVSNPDQAFKYCYSEGSTVDCNNNKTADGDLPSAPASNYFAQYEGQAGGWESTLSKESQATVNGLLYYALDGVTENTEFAYGAYDMGGVAVKYGDDTKVWYVDFIHYTDYGIDQIYADNKGNGYNAYQGVDSATYEAYRTAWNKIVYLATYPMMTTARNIADWNGLTATGTSANDYVSAIMPQIEPAIEAFETAKENYETALAAAQASGADASLPEYVVNLAAEIENDFANGKEINFQDYNFYEYFNYNDVKVAGENMYRTYIAPKVMDTYYIEGSGICEDELDYVIEYEDNSFIAAGITASRKTNEQADIDASKAALEEWSMPVTSKLIVDDLTARMAYYKTFLVEANMENTLSEAPDHLYFLNQEIAHVEAQQLDEADYTAASWANYAEALEIAKNVAADADPEDLYHFNSRIYDVKYNLMVAYKNLLKKDNSLIEAGGTAELQANAEKADAIFASLAAGDGAWAVKEGVDANTAYAQLISALGYNYQAVYSENDNEVQNGEVAAGTLKTNGDGTPMMFNLYADSALEYLENDRPNRSSNQAKVNTANANLEAAIANFEEAVAAEPELDGITDAESGNTGVVDIENGYVYGVTAGADDLTLFFTVENGTFEMVANEGGYTNGTGATLVVKNDEGETAAEYTLVVFGDVNGDGAVTATDTNTIKVAAMGGSIEAGAKTFAADVNGDDSVTASDTNTVKVAAMGGSLTVNPYAG